VPPDRLPVLLVHEKLDVAKLELTTAGVMLYGLTILPETVPKSYLIICPYPAKHPKKATCKTRSNFL
jgi:hypothetical protein